MQRWPKGYIGTDHETVGSSLLSVIQILKLPDHVLGAEDAAFLRTVDPEAWYPIGRLLSLMEKLESVVGPYGLLRMGRRRFERSHRARLPYKSARDVVYGIDEMYRFANRGQHIGGWTVLKFEPGYAELEKTTPHHCQMEQGILLAALSSASCPSTITQSQCFREGADSCRYRITSAIIDEHWLGGTPGKG